MIWSVICLFALYVVLSFPAVWAASKLDKDIAWLMSHDPDYRFIIVLAWPVFLCGGLVFQLRYVWDLIYFKLFQGEK